MRYEIYTDGSARKNGSANSTGAAAYAIIENGYKVHDNAFGFRNTTNQQMELFAAIAALDYYADQLSNESTEATLYSDSAYLINCVEQKWWVNWEKNGWKNSKKEPVANKELWERLIPYFKREDIKFCKVKGHNDVKWNEYVDELAQKMSASIM